MRTRARAAVLPAVLVAVATVGAGTVAGCGGGHPQAASRPAVFALVSQRPPALDEVDVSAGGRSARVDPQLPNLAPLLSDRVLQGAEAPSSYGLDHPTAVLEYRPRGGSPILIDVGSPDFDHHFLYVQREGDPRVFLVPSDTLRPVLALVGITLPAPT